VDHEKHDSKRHSKDRISIGFQQEVKTESSKLHDADYTTGEGFLHSRTHPLDMRQPSHPPKRPT